MMTKSLLFCTCFGLLALLVFNCQKNIVTNQQTSYSILFDANGGAGAPAELSKTFSVNIKLPSTLPIREGYIFLGWALSSTATKANFTAGQADITDEHLGKSEGSVGKVILYAIWKEHLPNSQVYSILFDANGGTGSPTELSKTFSVNIKLPDTLPIREGYIFLGWALSSTATKANFTAGQADITDEHLGKSEESGEDVILYAVWEEHLPNPQVYNIL
ncbi:MAG: InlB B-repeat-containing protein, partial [Bacteroidales bacterium]